MSERVFLTSHWRHLLVLNFTVPEDVLQPHAPPGTHVAAWGGKSYVSIVGFVFRQTRVLGVPMFAYGNFPEVNLRFYVERKTEDGPRHGVTFIREIAPRRLVSATAKIFYGEKYLTRRMCHSAEIVGEQVRPGGRVEYAWRDAHGEHRLSAVRDGAFAIPEPKSLEANLVNQEYGYGRYCRATFEYRVVHRPWRIAAVNQVEWQCDVAAVYGSEWVPWLQRTPDSALLVDGSAVKLYRGRKLAIVQRTPDIEREAATAAM